MFVWPAFCYRFLQYRTTGVWEQIFKDVLDVNMGTQIYVRNHCDPLLVLERMWFEIFVDNSWTSTWNMTKWQFGVCYKYFLVDDCGLQAWFCFQAPCELDKTHGLAIVKSLNVWKEQLCCHEYSFSIELATKLGKEIKCQLKCCCLGSLNVVYSINFFLVMYIHQRLLRSMSQPSSSLPSCQRTNGVWFVGISTTNGRN